MKTNEELRIASTKCRIDIIKMLETAGSGHPGSSLSAIDVIATLFLKEMRIDPKNLEDQTRDRFVLSKGHAVPALYSVLARLGIIKEEELSSLRKINSRLQGHPDRMKLPIVEASTGSLGQGLSIAQGMALALKLKKTPAWVYCLMGDGEIQEGQIWETAMSAPKFQLNNLVAFVDWNNGQIDGYVEEVMDIRPLADKWRSFRWHVQEINGHSFDEISQAVAQAKTQRDRPSVILAKTIKGKGVSFMENQIKWHGVAPNAEESRRAVAELERGLK